MFLCGYVQINEFFKKIITGPFGATLFNKCLKINWI